MSLAAGVDRAVVRRVFSGSDGDCNHGSSRGQTGFRPSVHTLTDYDEFVKLVKARAHYSSLSMVIGGIATHLSVPQERVASAFEEHRAVAVSRGETWFNIGNGQNQGAEVPFRKEARVNHGDKKIVLDESQSMYYRRLLAAQSATLDGKIVVLGLMKALGVKAFHQLKKVREELVSTGVLEPLTREETVRLMERFGLTNPGRGPVVGALVAPPERVVLTSGEETRSAYRPDDHESRIRALEDGLREAIILIRSLTGKDMSSALKAYSSLRDRGFTED